jgi:hypothetical protein
MPDFPPHQTLWARFGRDAAPFGRIAEHGQADSSTTCDQEAKLQVLFETVCDRELLGDLDF